MIAIGNYSSRHPWTLLPNTGTACAKTCSTSSFGPVHLVDRFIWIRNINLSKHIYRTVINPTSIWIASSMAAPLIYRNDTGDLGHICRSMVQLSTALKRRRLSSAEPRQHDKRQTRRTICFLWRGDPDGSHMVRSCVRSDYRHCTWTQADLGS